MKNHLDIKTFSAFKSITGSVFLILSLFLPLFALVSWFTLFFAKVHSLGAWIAMWKAKKFTWYYISYISFLMIFLSYWGIKVSSLWLLSFIAFTMFAFHFIYDEYELQEEKRENENIFFMFTPFVLLLLILLKSFFYINIGFNVFIYITIFLIILEFIFIKKINWIYLNSKFLTIFLLLSVHYEKNIFFIMYTLLMSHYIFWFAFPVYKLNKYKPEERDGFIMILIIIILMSAFIYSIKIWGGQDAPSEVLTRTFYIATIIHVLSTAPFAYFFGLKKSTYANIKKN